MTTIAAAQVGPVAVGQADLALRAAAVQGAVLRDK